MKFEETSQQAILEISKLGFDKYFDQIISRLDEEFLQSQDCRKNQINELIDLFILLISNVHIFKAASFSPKVPINDNLLIEINANFELFKSAIITDAQSIKFCRKLPELEYDSTIITGRNKSEHFERLDDELMFFSPLFSSSRTANFKEYIPKIKTHYEKFAFKLGEHCGELFPSIIILTLYLTVTRSYFNNKTSGRQYLFWAWDSFAKRISAFLEGYTPDRCFNIKFFLFQLQLNFIIDFYEGRISHMPSWQRCSSFFWRKNDEEDDKGIEEPFEKTSKTLYCFNNNSQRFQEDKTKSADLEINPFNILWQIVRMIDESKEMPEEVKISNLLFLNHYSRLLDYVFCNKANNVELIGLDGICIKYLLSKEAFLPIVLLVEGDNENCWGSGNCLCEHCYCENQVGEKEVCEGCICRRRRSRIEILGSIKLKRSVDLFNKITYYYAGKPSLLTLQANHLFYDDIKKFMIGHDKNSNLNKMEYVEVFHYYRLFSFVLKLVPPCIFRILNFQHKISRKLKGHKGKKTTHHLSDFLAVDDAYRIAKNFTGKRIVKVRRFFGSPSNKITKYH